MADSLYLSLWFRNSDTEDLLVHALSVMRQFPFSEQQPGIGYVALHPVSWNEATILEQRFRPGGTPEEVIALASGFLHDDYAYVFEANWDLWFPLEAGAKWTSQPSLVKFLVRGAEFSDGEAEQEGQIQVDFGVDAPFLHEETLLTSEVESKVRNNVHKLVEFTNRVEKSSGASARLLWSDSAEENLAQKLITRLQKVQ